MKKPFKFIWSSNAHWSQSGYGVFTRDLLFRIRDDKVNNWDFAEIGWFGLQGGTAVVDDILVYPSMGEAFGSDAVVYHTADFGANAVFTMQDVWTLNPEHLSKIRTWIPYCPIDKDPVPPLVLDRLRYAYKIITFSEFGQQALSKAGFTSTLIPEGVDTNIFKPMDKMACRKELGIPEDIFLFSVIAANKENPPRKGFQEMLEAFAMFVKQHPKSGIFFHTQQIMPGNFPIFDYAKHLGIEKHLFFKNQYVATYKSKSLDIAKELNASDVCLHSSQTEGFGLVIVESQSCGVPVIVSNCHSMPELVIPHVTGEICETSKPRWTSDNSFVYPADVPSLFEKMDSLYQALQKKNTIAKDSRAHVIKNYNIDTIFKKHWIPFLKELKEDLTKEDIQK